MIDNLELKLSGELPINKFELLELVNSWGRKDSFNFNGNLDVNKCKPNECYNLSNLDISQITDLSNIFRESMYNGDISNWDVSNVTNMFCMFNYSDFNNDSLKDWNVSNVEDISYMFCQSKFNGNLSNWDISNCERLSGIFSYSNFNNDSLKDWNISNIKEMTSMFECSMFDKDISSWKFNDDVICNHIFYKNTNFQNKYNDKKIILFDTKEFLKWFEKNRDKIRNLNTSKEEVLDFFSFPCFSEQVMQKQLNCFYYSNTELNKDS